MTKTEQFQAKVAAIPDAELAEKCDKALSKLCETGGKSFTMCVPPMTDDTDILFAELIGRFENQHRWISVENSLPAPLKTVWISNGRGFTTLGCRGTLDSDGNWCWAETNGIIYEEDDNIISECESEDLDVKYWHPVPEPPKEEK